MKKVYVEFYRRNAKGQFISLNDGIEFRTQKSISTIIQRVISRLIARNERGMFKKVQAYQILKNGNSITPILTL